MTVMADHVARPQPCGHDTCPEYFEKALEAPCPFHGGQAKHLLKDYATIRGYIDGTLGQQGKAQKLAQKPAPEAGEPTHTTPEDDAEFPKANHCLMIFGGS
jgi:hypothetical protein